MPFSQMSREHLTRAEFERVINEALESLPTRFANLVENVVIATEDESTEHDLESLDGGADAQRSCSASTEALPSPNGRTA